MQSLHSTTTRGYFQMSKISLENNEETKESSNTRITTSSEEEKTTATNTIEKEILETLKSLDASLKAIVKIRNSEYLILANEHIQEYDCSEEGYSDCPLANLHRKYPLDMVGGLSVEQDEEEERAKIRKIVKQVLREERDEEFRYGK
jgi:hypothetical protein